METFSYDQRIRAMFASPQLRTQLDVEAAEPWGYWVGDWLGLEIPAPDTIDRYRAPLGEDSPPIDVERIGSPTPDCLN